MNALQKLTVSAGVALNFAFSPVLFAQTAAENIQTLQGDVKLACEAILCLSSSIQPAECNPSINRFYSIVRSSYSATVAARLAFLRQCPVGAVTVQMASLTDVISKAYDRCDADHLNQHLVRYAKYKICDNCEMDGGCSCNIVSVPYISNQKPSYCQSLENHEYTRYDSATYVGEPMMNGYWVVKTKHAEESNLYNSGKNGKKKDLSPCSQYKQGVWFGSKSCELVSMGNESLY